jgi:hypothetical protein
MHLRAVPGSIPGVSKFLFISTRGHPLRKNEAIPLYKSRETTGDDDRTRNVIRKVRRLNGAKRDADKEIIRALYKSQVVFSESEGMCRMDGV